MSRVTEAMRRAADAGDPSAAAVAAPKETAAPDTAELAREPFPVEKADHRRPRPESASPSPEVSAAASERMLDRRRLLARFGADLTAKVVVDQNTAPESREQYRRLAATLHQAQAESGVKVVMIASALSGEGKTLTASNLALTFSESYKRTVLLIDGDLRRPSLHTVFGIDAATGLAEALLATEHKMAAVHQVSTRLAVLPAGAASTDPMAGLTSNRMRRLIEEARAGFDWVILDSPPTDLLTDANLMASMVDGTILVIKAESTPYDAVQRTMQALGPDHILGVVLNKASTSPNRSKYGEEYYSRSEPTEG